jgi:hypothetical protein
VTNSFSEFKNKLKALIKDYKIKKAIKSLDILKKEFVKVKSYYNKITKKAIVLFK